VAMRWAIFIGVERRVMAKLYRVSRLVSSGPDMPLRS